MEAARRRLAELGGGGGEPGAPPAPPLADAAARPEHECAVCMERPRDCALQCGHRLCMPCSSKVQRCPVCRQPIQHRIRLYS